MGKEGIRRKNCLIIKLILTTGSRLLTPCPEGAIKYDYFIYLITPISTKFIANQLNFGSLKGRKVIADFSGGRITSDAGIIWLAELDKNLKITAKFAECFRDYRDSSYTDYSVAQLRSQRVYGIVLGYEDLNDHDKLRYDPALAIALRKLNFIESTPGILAGKSTINRLNIVPKQLSIKNKVVTIK